MRISRKMEHIHHALRLGQSGDQGFGDIKLIPNSLPCTASEQISLHTRIGELNLSSPILINAMTGGAQETEEINRELAVAARETGLAMAVGSQMSALKNPETVPSYKIVRKMNPDGLVFANLGSEASVEQAQRAVDMLRADALQIHLNVMQELIMPEGDRDFRGMLDRIEAIVREAGVPVIVKEVGFGMSREDASRSLETGVRILDVGGAGGTNFAAIENARRDRPMDWLNDWGCKTGIALLEVLDAADRQGDQVSVIASGGIAGSLDICKALTLGASAAGMAGAMLRVLRGEGTGALISYIGRLHEELILLMTALGSKNIGELRSRPVIISGETAEWCALRGIDLASYARRNGFLQQD
ncbi:type 2 isopentenyl-diphosphate Delta-isomerase [Paenibacillus sp. P25]|nr:type 2 isopentenyl-diphosphate Delta-isomerase [Paenibacillus sp. P25]